MTDIVSPEDRSRMMSGIKAKNSLPEIAVRRILFGAGYRFRLHRKDLPGSPDIVLPRKKIAIFVHGCFWHLHKGCRFAKIPATRIDFWKAKLEANVSRDRRTVAQLRSMGWRVLWVWECALKDPNATAELKKSLRDWIENGLDFGEIRGLEREQV